MKLFANLVVLLFTVTSLAQTATSNATVSAAPTLKSVMQQMSTALKAITAQATDSTKNANSAELAGQFVKAAQQAKTILPSTANDDASKVKYAQMIDGVIASGQQLQAAFASNDNTKASSLLSQLVQEKKDGHSEFRQ